jgi:hypothetical protein
MQRRGLCGERVRPTVHRRLRPRSVASGQPAGGRSPRARPCQLPAHAAVPARYCPRARQRQRTRRQRRGHQRRRGRRARQGASACGGVPGRQDRPCRQRPQVGGPRQPGACAERLLALLTQLDRPLARSTLAALSIPCALRSPSHALLCLSAHAAAAVCVSAARPMPSGPASTPNRRSSSLHRRVQWARGGSTARRARHTCAQGARARVVW